MASDCQNTRSKRIYNLLMFKHFLFRLMMSPSKLKRFSLHAKEASNFQISLVSELWVKSQILHVHVRVLKPDLGCARGILPPFNRCKSVCWYQTPVHPLFYTARLLTWSYEKINTFFLVKRGLQMSQFVGRFLLVSCLQDWRIFPKISCPLSSFSHTP